MVLTNLSACGFQFGLCAGIFMHSAPLVPNRPLHALRFKLRISAHSCQNSADDFSDDARVSLCHRAWWSRWPWTCGPAPLPCHLSIHLLSPTLSSVDQARCAALQFPPQAICPHGPQRRIALHRKKEDCGWCQQMVRFPIHHPANQSRGKLNDEKGTLVVVPHLHCLL